MKECTNKLESGGYEANMIELKDTIAIYFDVDDTLIMWDQSGTKWPDKDEVVIRPDSRYPVLARPHHEHIKLLKKHKQHGEVVIVWSAGGARDRILFRLGGDFLRYRLPHGRYP